MEQRLHISVSPQVYIFAAILLLIAPLPWLCGWAVAVLVHELSHCIALRLCGKKIDTILLNMGGASIQTESLSDWQTIFCSLAGPVGGLLLLFAVHIFPQAAICAVLLSIYNSLPIFPLDGGRALYGLMHMILPECIYKRICFILEKIVLFVIVFFGFFATFRWKLGVFPLCASVLFAIRMHKIKRPCKSTLNRVQ